MRSISKEEHENYKDELGDSEFTYPLYSTAAEIGAELFRTDYRPILYEYYYQAKSETRKGIREMWVAIMEFAQKKLSPMAFKA
jgi:hypothetical protein